MSLRALLKFFCLFIGTTSVYANTDSSRVADLIKIVNENRMDSTLAYANLAKALDIAQSSKDKRLLGDVYITKGVLLYLESQFDSCEIYWKEASLLFSESHDTINWGKAERLVGVAFDLQGRLDSSLTHLQHSLAINKSINYNKGIGEVFSSLGIIQQKLERFDAAVETYMSALQLALDEKNEAAVGPIYNNLGSLYQNINELDSGMKYLQLALSMQDKVKNPHGMAKILHNLGTIELNKNNYTLAKNYYFTSIALTGGASAQESLQGVISIGNCYLKLGQYDSSKNMLLQAIAVSELKQGPRNYKSIYEYLWQIEENKGNFRQALDYHKLYSAYLDTIYDETLKKSIHELESAMELEFERNKNETLLKSSKEIEALLASNKKGLMLLVVLSIVLVLLVIILFRNLNRLKGSRSELATMNDSLLKNAQELEANNKKLEDLMTNKNDLVSVMAHDLRSPFGKIQSIVQLFEMTDNKKDQESYLQMVDNITHDGMSLIQDLIDLSRLEGNVLVEEHVKRLSTFKLNTIFDNLKSSFTSHLEAKQLELTIDLADESLLNREDYCERICDNILSNAIKYSNPGGTINVKSVVEDDRVKISILDNGPGFQEEDMNRLFQRFSRLSARPTGIESSTGLGLYIAKKLAESIHGDISLVSKIGESANFCIEVPINLKSKLEA